VLDDVLNGKVSAASARDEYGVALQAGAVHEPPLSVDEAATAILRAPNPR
jgi:hypothetical protein